MMKKTVVELFAGVGGFRCGLNNINTVEDTNKEEKWKTVWFSQYEPADKKKQLCIDTSRGNGVLCYWNENKNKWVEISAVYT